MVAQDREDCGFGEDPAKLLRELGDDVFHNPGAEELVGGMGRVVPVAEARHQVSQVTIESNKMVNQT